ncbi:cell division regulator GpsB [Paenalkalicoccus suaedae]|uniref:Cell division regulator GpsB n=1 Tax=Paenalkalicoccus suaedae TaxID=2592382 RepID=A0A859FFD2_9BACI|nr:cell division regulator GpsB [Paenalkalicoccus suaedae]QKS71304.1 cell division regulator GpsB [Paenalkalicoccus suaedae]
MERKLTAKLTKNEIYEKDFKSSMRGYNQDEVDQFLDEIIKDYEAFETYIQQLEEEVEKLKKQPAPAEPRTQAKPQPAPGNTNYDILRRLSNLEKHVFGSKLYD